MDQNFIKKIFNTHQECTKCPPTSSIILFFNDIIGVLFPNFSTSPARSLELFEESIIELKQTLHDVLYKNIIDENVSKTKIVQSFFHNIPIIYEKLLKDVEAMYEGDPAANSRSEVIRSYPGFYAIASYRVANQLAILGVKNIPRIITENAHCRTGIDIHPHATIGEYFCIDHGTGIVIGETAIIGNHVKMYQGVTLGALSVNKRDAKIKRHPTIGDHVVLYAGATILGGKTTIGNNSIIGGNVWLTKSIPANSRVYYQAMMHNDLTEQPDLIIVKQA